MDRKLAAAAVAELRMKALHAEHDAEFNVSRTVRWSAERQVRNNRLINLSREYTERADALEASLRDRPTLTETIAVASGLPKLSPFEKEVGQAIRAAFTLEVGNIAYLLVDMVPRDRARRYTSRLTAAAFRKGLVAGLSFSHNDPRRPASPYESKHLPNFMRGDNDPRDAWEEGLLNGERIRSIVLTDGRAIIPGVQYREYEVLTPEMRGAVSGTHKKRNCPTCKDNHYIGANLTECPTCEAGAND